jgi:hypothetical protein
VSKRYSADQKAQPTDSAICGECGKDRTKPDRGMYAPCWNCVERGQNGRVVAWTSPTGCPKCFLIPREDATCAKCGVYISRSAFVVHGPRLPAYEWGRYPAAWRAKAMDLGYSPPRDALPPWEQPQ